MAATTASTPSPPPQPSLLHNLSFTLTRLTPLFSLNPAKLAHYAHEFRDIVRGDSLRGVPTTAFSADKTKSALVRSCVWTTESDLMEGEAMESLVVKVAWDDGSTFTAILLPDFTSDTTTSLGKRKRGTTAGGDFTSFPLMLSRGSPVVRDQLVNYLNTRFDCRASEVTFPPTLLQETLQGYLERSFKADVSPARIEKKIRILEVVFTVPEVKETKVRGALRKITISLPTQDVHELYQRSATIWESLEKHVRASTAIGLDALTVSRIACAGVIMDSGGKLKIFESAGMEGTRYILGRVIGFVAKDILPV